MNRSCVIGGLLLAGLLAVGQSLGLRTKSVLAETQATLNWQEFEPAVLQRAKDSNRLVLLSLEAGWCHWCHVMKDTTYRDPKVVNELNQYVLTRADADQRLDLAARYQDYGWPATIVMTADGKELAAFSGYQEAKEFATSLAVLRQTRKPLKQAAFESAGPVRASSFTVELRRKATREHFEHYDFKLGGFGFSHKFLNWNSCEYALLLARLGDRRSEKMARQTLDAQLSLIDPAFGGVYQYSDSGIWTSPHYEKVMDHQAGNLRTYALAYSQFGTQKYRAAAKSIVSFLSETLRSPEGAFYASQDADPPSGLTGKGYFGLNAQKRRALGTPRVDQHLYSRENGWAIEALVGYFQATGDRQALELALSAGTWLKQHLAKADGSFVHQAADINNPRQFLIDCLAGAQAFLCLYQSTGDEAWLEIPCRSVAALEAKFASSGHPGLRTCSDAGSVLLRDENIAAAHFLTQMEALTHDGRAARLRKTCLEYLAHPSVALETNPGGVLLAEWESRNEPIFVTAIGDSAWFSQVQGVWGRFPSRHKGIRYQPRDGAASRCLAAVEYPVEKINAVYLCRAGQCKRFITVESLETFLEKGSLNGP